MKGDTSKGAVACAVVIIGLLMLDYLGLVQLPYVRLFPMIPSALTYVAVSLLTRDRKTSNPCAQRWI